MAIEVNKVELYEVTHSSPEIKTVQDYLERLESPAFSMKAHPEDFLNIKGPDGLTNRERIESKYITTTESKAKGKSASSLILKAGTKLYIPVEKVNRIGLLTEEIS